MTVKVRSSEGEALFNDTTPDIDSPSSITAGDLLAIIWCMNDDPVAGTSITPPAGFGLVGDITDAAVGDRGMRYLVWTKIATATDATNQGTANYYAFSGMDGTTDILYGIFSLYDDGGDVVRLRGSSLDDNHQNDLAGSTTAIAPTQTIAIDGSMAICCWASRQGTDYFNIDQSNSYSPTGGANATVNYEDAWTSSSMSDLEWVVGSAEFDIEDSPIGTQTLTHLNITGDPDPVDCYSISMVFEAVSATTLEIFVGNSALPTASTGTTDLTSADLAVTPVGVLHNASRANSASTLDGDAVYNFGMSDGTTDRSMSCGMNDGTANDDATCGYHDACVSQTSPGSQVEDGSVSHNSFISGGQRVNNDNGFNAAELCGHMFFAGCDFSVEEVTLNASVDTKATVDPGFDWDVVIVTHCRETVLDDEDADSRGSIGFYVKADDEQACMWWGCNNGDASPGGPALQINTNYAGVACAAGTGALVFGIDVQDGVSGTECDIYPRIAGGESVLVALAFIGFTDASSARIVQWDTPTSTGNNSITGTSGTPVALIHLISRAAGYNSAEADGDAGAQGVSFITDDSQFCVSSYNEFNTGGNSNCKNLAEPQSIRVLRHDRNTSSLNSYGSTHVSPFGTDGWTENWTHVEDGGAGKCVTLAFLEPDTGTALPLLGGSNSSGGF
jgi:hypothetical protein